MCTMMVVFIVTSQHGLMRRDGLLRSDVPRVTCLRKAWRRWDQRGKTVKLSCHLWGGQSSRNINARSDHPEWKSQLVFSGAHGATA